MKLSRTMVGASSLVALFGMALRSDVQADSPSIRLLLAPVPTTLTCTGPAGGHCFVTPQVQVDNLQGLKVIADCCDGNGKDGGICYMAAPGSAVQSTYVASSIGFGGSIEPAVPIEYNVSGSSGSFRSYEVSLSAYCAYWISVSFPTGFFYLPRQDVTFIVQVRAQ
jgi:hypothetical protein